MVKFGKIVSYTFGLISGRNVSRNDNVQISLRNFEALDCVVNVHSPEAFPIHIDDLVPDAQAAIPERMR